MPRTAQPLDARRKQRLRAAAAEEFVTYGYERASLNRIIDGAGIAKSSFYHYFADKHALYADLVAHLERTVGECVCVPGIDRLTRAEFWPAVEGMLGDLASALDEAPELATVARVLYDAGPAEATPELSRVLETARAWVARAITHGQNLGVVRRDLPPDLLSRLALAVFVELDKWALEHFEDPRTAGAAGTTMHALFAMLQEAR